MTDVGVRYKGCYRSTLASQKRSKLPGKQSSHTFGAVDDRFNSRDASQSGVSTYLEDGLSSIIVLRSTSFQTGLTIIQTVQSMIFAMFSTKVGPQILSLRLQ